MAQSVKQLKQEHPDARVEVWAEDEHRLGLHPVMRRVWVSKGEQPIAKVNWKYKWLWLAGFVQPTTGETYWWIVPRLTAEIFNLLLADFAQHFEVGGNKQVLLALDQASFHTSEAVEIPEGIHLLFFPPKSPELQPAERLWPLTNEAIANQCIDTLDELEEITFQRCRVLLRQPDYIRGITNFYWWQEAVESNSMGV